MTLICTRGLISSTDNKPHILFPSYHQTREHNMEHADHTVTPLSLLDTDLYKVRLECAQATAPVGRSNDDR